LKYKNNQNIMQMSKCSKSMNKQTEINNAATPTSTKNSHTLYASM